MAPQGGKRTLEVEEGRGCSSLLRKAKKRSACHGEDTCSRAWTEDTVQAHTCEETIDQNSSPSRPSDGGSSQETQAVNELETDKHQVPAPSPDSQVQLMREQAACVAHFFDLLLDLVPFDAIIPREATPCSETTPAGITSRGMLRWNHRCVRYDPDVLRATSVCLEQHARHQEKRQEKPEKPLQSQGGKKADQGRSRIAKQRKKKRHGKHQQQRHGCDRGQEGQRQGKHGLYVHQRICFRESAKRKCGQRMSGEEAGPNRNIQGERMKRNGLSLYDSLSGSRVHSRESTYARANLGAHSAGSNSTSCAPSGCEGERAAGSRGKKRPQGDARFSKSSNESSALENNPMPRWRGAKRRRGSRKYHARTD